MPSAREILTEFQAEITEDTESVWGVEERRRLNFVEVHGLFYIEYYGHTHRSLMVDEEDEEPDEKLPVFEILANPEIASKVASLSFDGPDLGANGTRDWDFSWLLAQEVTYPELKTLVIPPSPMEAHNLTILGFEADGQLAGWLTKAPKLSRLTTPSAPNLEFFNVEHEPLYSMRVSAGYDPADFILNLSRLPEPLTYNLDWNEVHNWHVDQWENLATPYEHFEALFTSPACPGTIILRNPKLDEVQLKQLAKLYRETQQRQRLHSWLRVFRTSYGTFSSSDPDGMWHERDAAANWTDWRTS